ncbi:hypothetical protein MKX47_21365 [Solibacillus sp. FSL R7-0668]|uniref:hypothetical protein n=1 Tax=Solibacillus sp. FSL R7-0668 TaxID=2921688 RepID=UPI0030F898A4
MLEESFTILKPIYYLLSATALFNFIYLIIFFKKNNKYSIYIPLNTLLILIISCVLFYLEGHIIDALVMSGNSLAFYSIFITFLCFLLCLIVPLLKKETLK